MTRELFEVIPEDYEKIKRYFKLRKPITCENVITDTYIWKNYYKTKYYINNGDWFGYLRLKMNIFRQFHYVKIRIW